MSCLKNVARCVGHAPAQSIRSVANSDGLAQNVDAEVRGVGETVGKGKAVSARQEAGNPPHDDVGATGPERGPVGRVDDQVAIVLHDQERARVAVGAGRPQGNASRVVEHKIAIGLHVKPAKPATIGGTGPAGGSSLAVHNQIAVTLHD